MKRQPNTVKSHINSLHTIAKKNAAWSGRSSRGVVIKCFLVPCCQLMRRRHFVFGRVAVLCVSVCVVVVVATSLLASSREPQ